MSINVTPHNSELTNLNDSGLSLADESQDIRGRKVFDRTGDTIGHISDLFIDSASRKVRMLEIRAGGFLGIGERHALLPVDAVTSVTSNSVHVNETRERLVHSPAYDPRLMIEPTPDAWVPYYDYYGLSPYWGAGYMYPDFPISGRNKPIRD